MTTFPHPYADYWTKGLLEVPRVTGADRVMDCRDLLSVFSAFAIEAPVRGSVLDVGCGTGRLAGHCAGAYVGLDISEDCVEYCRRSGLEAHLIGAEGLAHMNGRFDWVFCFSVFTHVGSAERADYLRDFRKFAPRAVADVIPGDGSGDVAKWTADTGEFVAQLDAVGWHVKDTCIRLPPVGDWMHRYYLLEAA